MENAEITIGANATAQINELIQLGWDFFLHYGDHETYCEIDGYSWEADFTKRKDDKLWDNHESGYGLTASDAITNAYNNIKNGKRLGQTRYFRKK
jgi:hypothetical protein